MEVQFKVGKSLIFNVEGKEQRDVFAQMATLHEVFGVSRCEICKGEDIKPVLRVVEENEFFEYVCNDPKCGAKLALGVHKKGGGLYPIRKLKNGVPAKVEDQPPFDWSTKGWHKFDKDKAAAAKAARTQDGENKKGK